MYTLKFDTGEEVNFDNKPTDSDVEEVVSKLGIKPKKAETVSQPLAKVDKPGLLERAGNFIAKDTLGVGPQQDGGFLGDIYQSTLGSKGLAGVAQLPGKVASAVSEYAPGIGQHQSEDLYGSSQNLSDQAVSWFEKAKQASDPATKQHYIDLATQLHHSAMDLNEHANVINSEAGTTGKQALGTSLNAATTAASFGTGPLSPTKVVVNQGKNAFLKSAGTAAAKNFVSGASFGAANDLNSNQDWKTTAKDAFLSGITNSVVQTGLSTAAAGIKVGAKKTAETLMNSALDISKKIIQKGKSPAGQLLDDGTWGTLGQMYRQVSDGIESSNDAIIPKLKSAEGGISEAEVRNGIFETLKKQLGDIYSDVEINDMVNNVPLSSFKEASKKGEKFISWQAANKVRQQLDNEVLGDRFYNSSGTSSLEKKAYSAAANYLRKTIQSSTNTASEFAEQSKLITARKALDSALAGAKRRFGIGLYDIAITGFGATQGDTPEDRLMNAAKYFAAEKVARSPFGKSGMSQLLNKSTEIGSRVASSVVGQTVKTATSKAISKLTSKKSP